MSHEEQLNNVPKKDVPSTVKDYLEDQVERLVIEKNVKTGKWNITATVADDE